MPVLLNPLIDAIRAEKEGEDENEMNAYRVLSGLLCSKAEYTRVSLKMTTDLLTQGGSNLDESTIVALLRLLKVLTDSSEVLTKAFSMDLRRIVRGLETTNNGGNSFEDDVMQQDTKLSTFDKVPVPKVMRGDDDDESWEDTPVGMAVLELRENLGRLSIGFGVESTTPLAK